VTSSSEQGNELQVPYNVGKFFSGQATGDFSVIHLHGVSWLVWVPKSSLL
jgi:hypothetical protein